MTRTRLLTLCLAVLPLVALSCSSARTAPPAVVGVWEYGVDTPDGLYTGTLTITGTSVEDLAGTMVSATEGNRSYPMENVAFAESTLSFTVPHPEFGDLAGEAMLGEDDMLKGTLNVPGQGDFSMTAERGSSDM